MGDQTVGEMACETAYERSGHMKRRVVVVCDNTMGIPGGEIDDGLAILSQACRAARA